MPFLCSKRLLPLQYRLEDLLDDLTPFITQITQDHISGGGFGDVWKCNYTANGTSAVKISQEIGILTILRHNNIVPLLGTVTGFGQRSELCSLVTPWIPNDTLNAYLASNHGDLTVLDHSHMTHLKLEVRGSLLSVYIMHGDITGANILIDEGGQVKLISFGLSTIVQLLLSQLHLGAMSIHPGQICYAAPELVLSEEVCDIPLKKPNIYSFGCVTLQVSWFFDPKYPPEASLNKILSGRHPWFETKSNNHIIVMISQGCSPQHPNSHPTIMDSDWDIIQKCLQFRPKLQPSADEVLNFVMCRPSSSDFPSLFDDPPNDAQSGLPGAPPHHDPDNSHITKNLVKSDANDNECQLVDLTTKIVKEFTHATAQGSFGDIWKCRFSGRDDNVEVGIIFMVAIKCVRIEIHDNQFKDIINKRLMDNFCRWKPLHHDNILTLCGIAYGFGPVAAIITPWMSNGSLSTYLNRNYDNLSQAHKFSLASLPQ
ncbi:kinase-like domain-containing protein [Suillus subaureus]|uniref:Kinase-like domain-containing protein n=1 Tax=Suillus subaureus TaxID=48587 RepID=A0A9P7EEJ5_9AGAM|nr:kinase-like domain-containing protein [Suillus subaureus]KAG1819127.1 kinase-like domain-containing protein [Suillus subaureus]